MIRAKKSLGQNFLISPRVVESIAAAGNLAPGERVIEIGPGKGALTRALLRSGARVRAIEKDDRLVPILAAEFAREIAEGRLELYHGDVTETPVAESLRGISEPYKVIANIPYYVTGAIIRDFLSAEQKPESMVLMVQKEVADRIIARDGKESVLSISVKAYAHPELIMNVSRGNFYPIPNVDSAVIRLSRICDPFKDRSEEARFFEVLRAGFAQKRKKLASNLAAVIGREEIVRAFGSLGIDGNARAEDLPKDAWSALARCD